MAKIGFLPFIAALLYAALASAQSTGPGRQVGPTTSGTAVLPNAQLVQPAGQTIAYGGRPLDLCLSPDGSTLYVKNKNSVTVVDAGAWRVRQVLAFGEEEFGSMHGIVAIPGPGDGTTRLYVTEAHKSLLEAETGRDGITRWTRSIPLPGAGRGSSHGLGIALSPDKRTTYVCLSMNNTLGVVDLKTGTLQQEISVGVCPYEVAVSADGSFAYVTNFGGRRPTAGQKAEHSAGTPVAVDSRSIALGGTVTRVDLKTRMAVREISVGLHPAQIILTRDGSRAFVANANSDSVSIIDTKNDAVLGTIDTRADPHLLFGSITNALALSADEKTLYCANAGNNAIAVIDLAANAGAGSIRGFIPTDWFPGGVVSDGKALYISNTKGEGSRDADPADGKRKSTEVRGSIQKVPIPTEIELAKYSAVARAHARVPESLSALQQSTGAVPPVPVPRHVGEPSVFHHIVYILKENRTYDQVFGDMPRGNADPKLCVYGKNVTPNQHALAEQFALLDNHYCNGVVSADGHQWATQGIVTDYQEKDLSGSVRSYDFGTDALCYASSNFLWDSVLLKGLSFRNYGEFDFPTMPNKPSWFDVYGGWKAGRGVPFKQSIELENLKRYTCPDYPGWNLSISDAFRSGVFLKEFASFEKQGDLPNLVFLYLPQDHTSGTGAAVPTPRAFVADNDLAVGKVVEAITNSRFWADTCIFINEDDPQNGFDHVDGHRSICLVISPYTKRNVVISRFYNQTSVLHTMTQMLGLLPMNQMVALAPTMEDCFDAKPDLRAFRSVPNEIALDEPNKPARASTPQESRLLKEAAAMDWSRPDINDDDDFNRLLWLATGRTDPYPEAFAGPHGRGLKALRLKLERAGVKDKDDD